MHVSIVVFAVLAAVAAGPVSIQKIQEQITKNREQRIIGGDVTTIVNYPFGAGLLLEFPVGSSFTQICGGSILNQRSVLTAAHCFFAPELGPPSWRIRVGSTYANSGGSVHQVGQIIIHPQFDDWLDNDFAIVWVETLFVYNNNVQPATIAGPNYNLADNQVVWAIGWGLTIEDDVYSASEQLRHVQVWTVNQQICEQRHAALGPVTASMLCSGWLDVGARDQCQGDSGGPLIHNNVVVGVCSWGIGCADPYYPGVNARVSAASTWISNNA